MLDYTIIKPLNTFAKNHLGILESNKICVHTYVHIKNVSNKEIYHASTHNLLKLMQLQAIKHSAYLLKYPEIGENCLFDWLAGCSTGVLSEVLKCYSSQSLSMKIV